MPLSAPISTNSSASSLEVTGETILASVLTKLPFGVDVTTPPRHSSRALRSAYLLLPREAATRPEQVHEGHADKTVDVKDEIGFLGWGGGTTKAKPHAQCKMTVNDKATPLRIRFNGLATAGRTFEVVIFSTSKA